MNQTLVQLLTTQNMNNVSMVDPLTGMQKSQPSVSQPTQTYNPPSQSGMSLFSDEKSMYDKMIADNVSDEEAHKMLKQRRTDLL